MQIIRLLVLFAFVGVGTVVSGQTRFVAIGGSDAANNCQTSGAPCATITHAIGQAGSGDTIQVAAGTYAEGGNPIPVNKSVRILGAQSGVNACPSRAGSESTVTVPFVITANSVEINGFTITCGACGGFGAGVHTNQLISGYAILDNIITGNTIGIYLNSSGALPSTVAFNRLTNNNVAGSSPGNGIYGDRVGTNIDVNANCFSVHDNADILLLGVVGAYQVDVTNNTFTEDGDASSGILFDNVDNSTVTGNTITGGGAYGVCAVTGVDNLLISGNTITGGTAGAAVGVWCADFGNGFPANGLITVERNVLRNNFRGVRDFGNTSVPIEVHCNVIEDNSVADIEADATFSPAAVDAENNWFGCNDLPNGCATLSVIAGGTIDANPWIVMDISAAPNPVNFFSTSTITVDFNQNSDGAPLANCFPDGQIVSFSAVGGTVSPPSAPTSGGQSTTTFTPTAGGAATVNGTLDDETVSTAITVIAADIQVTGTITPSVLGGTDVTKSLTVTNNGPSTATNVILTDPLPGSFVSASSSQGSCVNAAGTVICTIGTLTSGASATVTIHFLASLLAGPSSNTVTVDATEDDSQPANNTLVLNFTIGPRTTDAPTLSTWMLGILALFLTATAVFVLRN